MPDLPLPERRRSFTPKQRQSVADRQDWKCAKCGCDLRKVKFEIDHVHRIDALGTHTPENWQALCVPDHKAKTRIDNREAKKGARLRLEKGQQARRAKNGGTRIKSAPLKSRGFQKAPPGYVHKWGKR